MVKNLKSLKKIRDKGHFEVKYAHINLYLQSKLFLQWKKDYLVSFKYRVLKVGLSPSKKVCVICQSENSLKMMKNAFYFVLKAFFVLKIFKLLSWLFGYVGKTAWLEDKINFKIHEVTTWFTNNCNSHFVRLVPDLFLFFKKLNMRWKQVVCSLVSIYFDSPQLSRQ